MKTVPYSVRLASQDAEYLASLKIEGAYTPSDKLRSIVSSARERDERGSEFLGCIRNIEELTAASVARVKEIENSNSLYSELLLPVVQLASEVVALFISGVAGDDSDEIETLKQLEKKIADKMFTFFEKAVLMGMMEKNPCYSEQAIISRIQPLADIFEVLKNKSSKE
jgi:hypothetical protein